MSRTMRLAAAIGAVLLSASALAGCGGKGAAGEEAGSLDGIAVMLEDGGYECSSFETEETSDLVSSGTAFCDLEGESLQVQFFGSDEQADAFFEFTSTEGCELNSALTGQDENPYVRGPDWFISTDSGNLAEELGEGLGAESGVVSC